MKIIGKFCLALFILLALNSHAQEKYAFISLDNDILNLPNQSDRYYTNGLDLGYYHPFFTKSIVNYVLIKPKNSTAHSTGITFHQGIYTPKNIHTSELQDFDRPYASTALISQEQVSVISTNHVKFISSIGIGVIGKIGGGEAVQNFIHSLTPYSENANGWQHQIANDFLVDYKASILKGIINSPYIQLNLEGRTEFGTYKNLIGTGAMIMVGVLDPFYSSTFNRSSEKELTLNVFGRGSMSYLFFDATLEGGLFNTSEYYAISKNDVLRNRLNYTYGLQLNFKSIRCEVGRIWQSPEFKSAKNHAWGYIKFGWFY